MGIFLQLRHRMAG